MEASVDPQPRGPDWMPITPKTGSLFHAETHWIASSQFARELADICAAPANLGLFHVRVCMVGRRSRAVPFFGQEIDVAVAKRGALTRVKTEAKIHSGAKPEFYRIYKFEQATDVVRIMRWI
jgi:hypothetical protein